MTFNKNIKISLYGGGKRASPLTPHALADEKFLYWNKIINKIILLKFGDYLENLFSS